MQLRRAYDAQSEEIRRLKQQVALKDRRIRELEDQVLRFKTSLTERPVLMWTFNPTPAPTPTPQQIPEEFNTNQCPAVVLPPNTVH